MLTSTTLRSFRRICDVIGPTQLLVFWAVSIFIGWAGAGRHSALILWVLIGGVALSCVGLAFLFTGTLKLRRLRFAHRRFEQQGHKDARRLAWIAGTQFRAHHFVFAAAVLCVGGGVALSMKGLAVSGGLLALAILPSVILVFSAWSLNRSVVSGASLFLKPRVRRTITGRDAIGAMRHRSYVKSALSTAHIGNADGVAAREFLATVRHEDAFWPDISKTLSLDFFIEMKWRIFALCGVIWHALAAALLAIILAYLTPFSVFPPLVSPLDLLSSTEVEDEPQQAEEENADGEQGEGADGSDGGEQGEDADGSDGGEQGEGADGSDGGEQGEGADGSGGGEQGEGADGSDGGEQGEGAEGSDDGEQGEGADGSDGGEQGEGADGSDGGEQGQGADGSDSGEQGEGADGSDGGEQGEGADGSDGGEQGEGADGSDGGEQGEGADGNDGGEQGEGADGSDGGEQGEMSEPIEAQGTIQNGEVGTESGEQEVNIAGQGAETDRQDGVVLEERGEPADGDPESVAAATLTGGAAGENPRTDGVSFNANPFSARGLAPETVEVLQTAIPEFPDNLPPADPPTQRVPAWILQLERAVD